MRALILTPVAIALFWASDAWAQYPRPLPPPQPTTSPYLNLFRRGNSVGFNYYRLVRPELQLRASAQQQFQAIQQLQVQSRESVAPGTSAVAPTGHPTSYLNHTRFFQTYGTGPEAGIGRY